MDDYDMQRGFRIPKNSKHRVKKRTSRNTSLPHELKSSDKPSRSKTEFPHLSAEERSYLSENYRRPAPGQLYGKSPAHMPKKNANTNTEKKSSPASDPFSNAPRISSKDIVGHRVVTDEMADQHLQQKLNPFSKAPRLSGSAKKTSFDNHRYANPSKETTENPFSRNRLSQKAALPSKASKRFPQTNSIKSKSPMPKELDKKQLVERAAEILFQAAKHTRSKLRTPASEAINMKQEEQKKTQELGMIFDRNRKEILKYIKRNPKN